MEIDNPREVTPLAFLPQGKRHTGLDAPHPTRGCIRAKLSSKEFAIRYLRAPVDEMVMGGKAELQLCQTCKVDCPNEKRHFKRSAFFRFCLVRPTRFERATSTFGG